MGGTKPRLVAYDVGFQRGVGPPRFSGQGFKLGQGGGGGEGSVRITNRQPMSNKRTLKDNLFLVDRLGDSMMY